MGPHLLELVVDPPPLPVQLGFVQVVDIRVVLAVADVRKLFHPPLAPREVPEAVGLLVQPPRIRATLGVSFLGEAELLAVARRLVQGVEGSRVQLRLGAFDEGLPDPELVVVGPRGGGLHVRRSSGWRRVIEAMGWRSVVLNTVHPLVQSQLRAAERDPVLAAQGLLMVVLDEAFGSAGLALAQQALVEVRR